MNWQHKILASGKWHIMTLPEQMANIGSEVIRALNWQKKGDDEYARHAFYRALELLDLTLADPKNIRRLKELARWREVLGEYFCGTNRFGYTSQSIENYFFAFNYYIALNKKRNISEYLS